MLVSSPRCDLSRPLLQFHLFDKDKEEPISISSEESQEDSVPSASTLPDKSNRKKQHSSSRIPKKDRKKRTSSESSGKPKLKNYPASL